MKFISIIAIVLVCVSFGSAEIFKSCRTPQLQSNFNVGNYTGLWYEIQRSPDMPFEHGDCSTANYTLDASKPGHVIVVNTERVNGTNGVPQWNSEKADAVVSDPSNPAQLSVTFQWPFSGDYRVVSTNYKSYSVVYSCQTFFFGLYRTEYAWVLSRNTTLSQADESAVQSALSGLGLGLQTTNQQNCTSK